MFMRSGADTFAHCLACGRVQVRASPQTVCARACARATAALLLKHGGSSLLSTLIHSAHRSEWRAVEDAAPPGLGGVTRHGRRTGEARGKGRGARARVAAAEYLSPSLDPLHRQRTALHHTISFDLIWIGKSGLQPPPRCVDSCHHMCHQRAWEVLPDAHLRQAGCWAASGRCHLRSRRRHHVRAAAVSTSRYGKCCPWSP